MSAIVIRWGRLPAQRRLHFTEAFAQLGRMRRVERCVSRLSRHLRRVCSLPSLARRAVVELSGATQYRSNRVPSTYRIVTASPPTPIASFTPAPRATSAATSAGARVHAATMSMSRTTGQRRLIDPAISAADTPGTARISARNRSASASACGYSMKSLVSRRYAMPRAIFAAVFAPKRGSAASRPSRAAASRSWSVSNPSLSWMARIFVVPSPGTRSISRSPSGVSSCSCVRSDESPPAASSVITASVAGPTPRVLASAPLAIAAPSSPSRTVWRARAAVRYAPLLKPLSPFSSSRSAIWPRTCAAARGCMPGR